MILRLQSPIRPAAARATGEAWVVGLGLALFLLLNLLTASRYPFVWLDEVMYADPTVNLLRGNGWTSTAWYVQSSGEFWAGNVPLHPMLLVPWLKIFGVSITAVRSINLVYVAASAWLLWRSCGRLELVKTAWSRLLLLALVLGGYSLIFSYRSGRPDGITLLIASLFLWAQTLPSWRARHAAFLALGFIAPWAGLQLLPLLAVGGVLLAVYLGRTFWTQVAAAWLGAGLGGAALVGYMSAHGVLGQFVKTSQHHTSFAFFAALAHGELRHSNMLPKDFSFWFLFLLALLLALSQWRAGSFKNRSALSFGLVYSMLLSVALVVAGKFPTYYGWMTYVPLAICLCATISATQLSPGMRIATVVLLSLAIAVGVGLHGAAALYNWSDRDYDRVTKLVRENVRADDWCFGEFGTYYAVKATAARAFLPTYETAITPAEKARVSVLVAAPEKFAEYTNYLGGNWVDTGRGLVPQRRGFLGTKADLGFLTTQDYRLEVYRRAGTGK